MDPPMLQFLIILLALHVIFKYKITWKYRNLIRQVHNSDWLDTEIEIKVIVLSR